MAKSPTQIGGARTTYTNDEGNFRFVNLLPGEFEVMASSQGLETQQQKVRVDVVAPAEAYFIMKVATTTEVVEVRATAPLVNTSKATVKDTFDADFLDSLPLQSRSTQQDIVANQVAGAVGQRVRGGTSDQNKVTLEGFQITPPGGGSGGQIVPLRTVASLEVSAAGYGAENATAAGSVTNMVTKSGSNKYEFELNTFHEDSSLQFFRDELDSRERQWSFYSTTTFSGPIIKDKLWFSLPVEFRSNVSSSGKDPTGIRPDPPRHSDFSFRSLPKISWQVTPRNTVQFIGIFNRDFFKNGQRGFQYDRDAQWAMDNFNVFGGLKWTALLSDSLVFTTQLGAQQFQQRFGPQLCKTDPNNCDHISPFRQNLPSFYEYNNWNTDRLTVSSSVEFNNSLEYFYESKSLGSHSIKLTGRYYAALSTNKVTTPGDYIFVFNGLEPAQRRELFVNDPFVEDPRYGWKISTSRSDLLQFSLQDAFKPPSYRYLTITPGIGITKAGSQDEREVSIVDFLTWTPHLSAAWDVTQDGRTVIRSSFNQYVDPGTLAVAGFIGSARVIRACNWDPVTKSFTLNCNFEGGGSGRTVGLPCGPDGIDSNGNNCQEKLKVPRTTEVTFGAEREVIQGVAVGGDLIYRRFDNPFEDRETNRIWNQSGTALEPTGQYRNGRPQVVMDLGTPEEAKRRYLGVTGTIRKREGKLKINFAYTWSQLKGNVTDGVSNQFLNNPGTDVYLYGFLPGDSRHSIRTQAGYEVTSWLTFGAVYNYTSGTIYQRLFRNDVTQDFSDYRARTGFSPNNNINDPADDRPIRLPDIQDFGLQTRVNLRPLTKFNAQVWVDFLNLLALRTTTSVVTQDGPTWSQPQGRMGPMRLRVGLQFRF